jgi:hypothetical protein
MARPISAAPYKCQNEKLPVVTPTLPAPGETLIPLPLVSKACVTGMKISAEMTEATMTAR